MAKTKTQKFPETICIRVDPNSGEPPSFIAERTVEEAIDDDGPTAIAEYKFVRVRKFRKEAVELR